MNKTEKMPELELTDGKNCKYQYVYTTEEVAKLESFCTQQAEEIKRLTEASKKRSEYNRSLLSCINDWAEKYEKLEEENDILRADAQEKLKDYLIARNEKERIQEENRETLRFLRIVASNKKDLFRLATVAGQIDSFLSTQEKGEIK